MSNFNGFTGDNDPVYYSRKAEKADGALTNEDIKRAGNSPVIPDGSADMLRRWLAFGRGMQNAGSQLPHNLIAETEAMLAAAPQSPGSEPATVPGTWIPVSEQMPPSRHEVLVGRWWGEKPRWCCKWATYIPGHPDAQSSGWLIPGASWTPTHWMPLPAAPQEVNRE